ncbi:MAG: hypothetical protein IPJ01_11830 [Micavibrio sp.]|nr:hypothetical protein [Micavibrio sp.]
METKIEFFDKNKFFFRVLKGRSLIVGELSDLYNGKVKPPLFYRSANKESYTTTTMEIEITQDYENIKNS